MNELGVSVPLSTIGLVEPDDFRHVLEERSRNSHKGNYGHVAVVGGETGTIESMTAGYRMQTDSSRRIRLTPTWKIDTETGEYLVDCDKKTIIGEEN